MHQAEYLAHTVASLMMQRAELQRLREAVEAAEGSSLRGSGEKVRLDEGVLGLRLCVVPHLQK